MTEIIQFLQVKNEKEEQYLQKLFSKSYALDEKLDQLLSDKTLQLKDHQLFLAFLTYLQQQQIESQRIFRDVIQLPKHQFEQHYNMNWLQVVKLAATFLTILKRNEPLQYEQFQRALKK